MREVLVEKLVRASMKQEVFLRTCDSCVQCKRKFFSKQGENVCPNCMVEPINSTTYDPVACKALLLVLTNKKWWDIATSIVDDSDAFNTIIKTLIVSWTIGISLLLGGCLWL